MLELSRCRINEFLREIKEIIKVHRPTVIVLSQPRISSVMVDGVCRRLGERKWVRSEADGFSGGIWIF